MRRRTIDGWQSRRLSRRWIRINSLIQQDYHHHHHHPTYDRDLLNQNKHSPRTLSEEPDNSLSLEEAGRHNDHDPHRWFRRAIPPYRHPDSIPKTFSQLKTNDPILFPTTLTRHQNSRTNWSSTQQHREPQQQPTNHLRYPPTSFTSHNRPPVLTSAIASLYNAALVHLHRGLAIDSIRDRQPSRNDQNSQEPFLSAITRGFNQIVFLETGLEFSQPKQVIERLMKIVDERLSTSDHSRSTVDDWNQSKHLIIHAGLRPRIDWVGRWAIDEIKRGNYSRLIQVWSGILKLAIERGDPKKTTTIGLDPTFFTALVIVSSNCDNGVSLKQLILRLVNQIWSRVQSEINLDQFPNLPDPDRARHYLRAVELGLIWRMPNSREDRDPTQESTMSADNDQDQRVIHLLRRSFQSKQPEAIRQCLTILDRIQEATLGTAKHPGWIGIDWTEPDLKLENDHSVVEERQANDNGRADIALTQRVMGVLMTGFAELGMIQEVDRSIDLVRKLGGMSRYLWTSILRGLVGLNKPELLKRFASRMEVEDGLEADGNVRCIMISGAISNDLEGALKSIDQLILDDHSPHSVRLPIEALNTILSALLRHELIDRAEAILNKLSKRTQLTATSLNHFLNYHSRSSRPELNRVLEHLRLFESLGVKPDVVSFTILLNVLMKIGLGKDVVGKLLMMMEQMGIEPNAITYGSIIHHLCRSGNLDDVKVADGLLEEIEKRGVLVFFLSFLLAPSKQSGLNKEFLSLLSLYSATTDITYTALIQGLLRCHIEESTEANQTTNSLIRSTELIQRMKNRKQSINQVIYNSLLNALLSTGHYESGLRIFKLMRNEERDRMKLDVLGNGLIDSYGIVLRRLIQFGKSKLAREILNEFYDENFLMIPKWIQKFIDQLHR